MVRHPPTLTGRDHLVRLCDAFKAADCSYGPNFTSSIVTSIGHEIAVPPSASWGTENWNWMPTTCAALACDQLLRVPSTVVTTVGVAEGIATLPLDGKP